MCGLPYSQQAKIIALIEIVSSILGFGFVMIPTLALGLSPEWKKVLLSEESDGVLSIFFQFSMPEKVTSVAVPIIYFIGEFCLALFLYRSVTYRIYSHIRIWYIVTITICMSALYFFLPGVFFTDDSSYFIGIFFASYVFTAYSVWVVYHLMQELKSEGLHSPISRWEDDAEKL